MDGPEVNEGYKKDCPEFIEYDPNTGVGDLSEVPVRSRHVTIFPRQTPEKTLQNHQCLPYDSC